MYYLSLADKTLCDDLSHVGLNYMDENRLYSYSDS